MAGGRGISGFGHTVLCLPAVLGFFIIIIGRIPQWYARGAYETP